MSTVDAQTAFREAGVFAVVLNVLNIHSKDATVCMSALRAIEALANDDTNRELLISEGACETIIQLFHHHQKNLDLIKQCNKTIFELLKSQEAHVRLIENMGEEYGNKFIEAVNNAAAYTAARDGILSEAEETEQT